MSVVLLFVNAVFNCNRENEACQGHRVQWEQTDLRYV